MKTKNNTELLTVLKDVQDSLAQDTLVDYDLTVEFDDSLDGQNIAYLVARNPLIRNHQGFRIATLYDYPDIYDYGFFADFYKDSFDLTAFLVEVIEKLLQNNIEPEIEDAIEEKRSNQFSMLKFMLSAFLGELMKEDVSVASLKEHPAFSILMDYARPLNANLEINKEYDESKQSFVDI